MKSREWYANITITEHITDNEALSTLEALKERGAALTPTNDSVGISLTAYGEDVAAALTDARETLEDAGISGTIISATISTYEHLDAELARPVFPEMVGWAEVAKMAGVTRQRASQFQRLKGFPPPVIKTAQGPLMLKAAVAKWVETRDTRPGRRVSA